VDYNSFYSDKIVSSCYLIEGEDDFLKNLAVKKIKNDYNIEELDCSEFHEEINVPLIQSSLEVVPFFSEKRVVVVNEYYPKAKEVKELEAIFSNDKNSSILIICNKNKCEALKSINLCFVDCNKSETFLVKHVLELFKNSNLKIEKNTVNSIIDFCSCDAFKVDSECNKLIGFCLENGIVTLKDVENLVNKDLDYKVYELTEYIAKKQHQKAYEIIEDMLNKGESEHKIFVSIYNYFKRLFYCRLNSDLFDLVDVLGIKEYAVKKAIESSKRFTAVSLQQITKKFSEYDFNVKSGKISIKNALWLSIFQIGL